MFYKEYEVDPEPEVANDDRKRSVAKGYWVFNAEQVDGFEMPEVAPVSPIKRNARVDAFITATGAEVRRGGQSAHYDPREDIIQLSDEGLFIGTDTSDATEAYYSTRLHETCHWTGHKSRLDRDLGMRFGKDAYAAEELIAELGAAFLCADLQVTPRLREDHAQYIAHWLNIMKADKKAIFTAAAKANQALEYLQRMYGPTARRKPEIEVGERSELHQCIRPHQWSDWAPGHNGNPRASRAHKQSDFKEPNLC